MRGIDRRGFHGVAARCVAAGIAGVAPDRPAAARDEGGDPNPFEQPAIWDLHCHFSGVTGSSVEQRAEKILEYADRMKIDRLVFFMGWPWSHDPSPKEFRRQNDQVLRALEKWPDRLLGFAYVSAKHPVESLREVERCIAKGPMVGIKLWVARRCRDKEIDPIIRRCGELQAAIYQHTWLKAGGNLPGESTPMDLAQLAARHPKVPIICGHTGGDWSRGIRAVRATPNVSIGIGGSEPSAGMVEMAVRELGAKRVLYGSDAGGRSFATQLAKVYGAQISADDKRQILGGNLRRMLTPILRKKGRLK